MMRNIAFQAPRALGVALLLAACLAAGPRGAAAQDAATLVQNLGNEAIHVLGQSVPPAQRTAHFRRLFDSDFDLPGAARFVLGPNARALTPEQNQEFLTLFREYLAQAYSKRLTEYGGEPFRVTGSRPNGEETVVSSQVSSVTSGTSDCLKKTDFTGSSPQARKSSATSSVFLRRCSASKSDVIEW